MALDKKCYRVRLMLMEDLLGTVPQNKDIYARYIAGKQAETLAASASKKGQPHADGSEVTPESLAAMQKEEVSTVRDLEEKGWTGFHQLDDGTPFVYNYSVKGFCCESARTMKEAEADGEGVEETTDDPAEEVEEGKKKKPKKKAAVSDTIKQLQDKCKRYLFIEPRKILLPKPGGTNKETGRPSFKVNERPLRAMTAQGPRVTVTRSDVIPAGAILEFYLTVLHPKSCGLRKQILQDVLEYGEYMGLGQWRSGGWGAFVVEEFEEVDPSEAKKVIRALNQKCGAIPEPTPAAV